MIYPVPVSQVLLSVKNALQETITTDSGIKFFINPDYNREWNVATEATIAALPTNPSPQSKHILESLKVGDEICFSYQVISDVTFGNDSHSFMPSTEEDPYAKEFVNGKGETVRVYGLAKRAGFKGLIWVGTYQNKNREIISGVQGSESEIEKWLSQFPFGTSSQYTFNNLFTYDGKDYWKCFPADIFAKKVKGHWVAVGDRVICSPIDDDVPAELLQSIQHTESVKMRWQDRATVLSGGKKLNLRKGQVVSFDPKQCEKYKFGNKEYYLINERVVQGIWN